MTLIRPLAWAALAAGLTLAAGLAALADPPVPAGGALLYFALAHTLGAADLRGLAAAMRRKAV